MSGRTGDPRRTSATCQRSDRSARCTSGHVSAHGSCSWFVNLRGAAETSKIGRDTSGNASSSPSDLCVESFRSDTPCVETDPRSEWRVSPWSQVSAKALFWCGALGPDFNENSCKPCLSQKENSARRNLGVESWVGQVLDPLNPL